MSMKRTRTIFSLIKENHKKPEAKVNEKIWSKLKEITNELSLLDVEERISSLNEIKKQLHKISPFKGEPVDCVIWVKSNLVKANDYNPNIVAPPEMELLKVSIENDGYTQPIVAWRENNDKDYEIIDGFHRNRVGKEYKDIRKRIRNYLPLAIVNDDRAEKGDRIASTIRHNRARGKHTVLGMSDIILELKNRNWTNEKIAKQLGMDEDEILRLCQVTGLASLFSDQEFSKSWNLEDAELEETESVDFIPLEDDMGLSGDEEFKHLNTDDENRIFHTYEEWECYKAGFYKSTFDGKNRDECERMYSEFLSDKRRFSEALSCVISEWKNSCEHYLTNSVMNRIAWLGQAAMCYATGVPSEFRGGFHLLTERQQEEANEIALNYLNKWLENNGMKKVTMEEATSNKQYTIY